MLMQHQQEPRARRGLVVAVDDGKLHGRVRTPEAAINGSQLQMKKTGSVTLFRLFTVGIQPLPDGDDPPSNSRTNIYFLLCISSPTIVKPLFSSDRVRPRVSSGIARHASAPVRPV